MLMDTIKQLDSAAGIVKEDGTSPVTANVIYDIAGSTLSTPTDGAVLMRLSVGRSFVLPDGLAGSKAESIVPSTGAAAYPIKQNGTPVGTIDFATGNNDATFTFSGDVTFAVGDILTVEAPATADATHDEISWLLAAELV